MSLKPVRFRPFLVGDVARAAGVPRETLRAWLRKPPFDFERPKGWKRFTDFETILVCVYAALIRTVQNHELAETGCGLAAKLLQDEWIEEAPDAPVYFDQATFLRERFLIFWQVDARWQAKMADAPDAASAAMNTRVEESYSIAPAFIVINFGTIMRQVYCDITAVEIEVAEREEKA